MVYDEMWRRKEGDKDLQILVQCSIYLNTLPQMRVGWKLVVDKMLLDLRS